MPSKFEFVLFPSFSTVAEINFSIYVQIQQCYNMHMQNWKNPVDLFRLLSFVRHTFHEQFFCPILLMCCFLMKAAKKVYENLVGDDENATALSHIQVLYSFFLNVASIKKIYVDLSHAQLICCSNSLSGS